MTPCAPGCLGKLPIHGDFLRYNPGPEAGRLDELLQRGILRSREDQGASWGEAYRRIPPLRFVRHFADTRRLVAGVLVPSGDSVGRDFPFLVTCTLEVASVRRRPSLLPLLLEDFFRRAEALAVADHTGRSYRDIYGEVEALGGGLDERAAEQRLDGLVRETSLGELVERSLGAWDDRRFLLLLNMASLLGPRSRPRFVLALPPAPDATTAALWLELAAIVRGAPDLFPTLAAWSEAPQGRAAGLRCVLVEPGGEHFAPVFMAHVPSDACELHQEGLESPSLLEKARARFSDLGGRRDASLQDVAQGLRAAGAS